MTQAGSRGSRKPRRGKKVGRKVGTGWLKNAEILKQIIVWHKSEVLQLIFAVWVHRSLSMRHVDPKAADGEVGICYQ